MKNRKFLLFLSLPLLLTSCSDPGTTSQSSSTSSSDTSVTESTSLDTTLDTTTSVDVDHTLTPELFTQKAEELVNATSLTLVNTTSGSPLETYINEDYILYDDNTGYIMLPYAGSSIIVKEYLYNFKLVDNEIELGSILTEMDMNTGATVGADDTSIYNPFLNLAWYFDFDLEIDDLNQQEDGSLLTSNLDILITLARIVGLDESIIWEGTYNLSAKLYLDDSNYLSFAFLTNDGEVFENYAGSVKDVNSTGVELLDTYKENFKLPSEKLPESALEDLLDDTFSTVLTLNSVSSNGSVEEKISFDKEPTQCYLYSDNPQSSIASTLYKTLDNGNIGVPYITYNNECAEEDLGFPYSLVVPSLSSSFNFASYRKVDDTTYKYWDFVNPFNGLSLITINVALEEVNLKLDSNGKFDYIEGKSVTNYYEDGSYDYLEFKLEVVDDKKVPEVKPYEENEDTETITQIFENFKKETSYQLVNDYGGETFTVTDDVILSTSQDFMTGEPRYNGYLEKNGGVIKFSTEDGELVPAAPFKEGLTLQDYLTFDLSPLIFTLSEDGTKLSANDFVDGLGGHFVGGSNGGLCYLNSLVFDITDGKISGMTYQADLSLFIGETSYSVVYGTADAPITIPSDIRTSLDNMSLEFDIPTNFSDCAGELWTALVSMYGEEVALTIPYLYDETYHDGWDIETLTVSYDDGITWTPEYIRVFETSASATSDYLERYAALLLENGYEEVEDNVYQKGIVRITFGATLLEGFTFTKVSE